jgi:hypothetical protein
MINKLFTLFFTAAFAATATNDTAPIKCFYRTNDVWGPKGGTNVSDLTLLQSNPAFTPRHRVLKIKYCWSASTSLLTGVRVTVGLFGNSSSEIALNTFGTLAGTTCSFFTLKKDESISRVSVTYTMT